MWGFFFRGKVVGVSALLFASERKTANKKIPFVCISWQ